MNSQFPRDAALAAIRPAAGEPIVSLRGIRKTFHRGELAVEVLHGIDLDIMPGEFIAIMGASGSGKSTMMNLIGMLDRPTEGSYRLAGQEVAALGPDQRALARLSAFGFIFQQYNLLAQATATENVEVPGVYARTPRDKRRQRAEALLAKLGLADRMDHRPSQLSGGQQQRVSIARALMNGAPVILADEPTGALDSRSGAEVMTLLHELNQAGHTIILITHDREVAEQAGRIVELKDGNLIADSGRRDELPPALAPRITERRLAGAMTLFDFTEATAMALRSLKVNLLRTMLTLLGIIIGVASVVAMLAIGDGAKQQVLNRIGAMGTDLLLVRPGAPNMRPTGGVTATLVPDDAVAIATLPNVGAAVPENQMNVTIRYNRRDYSTTGMATTDTYPVARRWPAASGAFFSAADVRTYAPVIALGETVVRNVFAQGEDPVGKFVLVNNIPFQVVAVMAPKGATPWGADQDDTVFIPFTTGTQRISGQRHARTVTVQVKDVEQIDATQQAVREMLIDRHRGIEDFQIRNMASVLATASETQDTLTILLGSIAAIALLVGGIGVMNIMLVSVTERTREIGVRMATGARRGNIMLQFNIEALVVCIVGGVIGVVLGLGTAWMFQYFGRPILFSPWPVALAFGCACATGLLFGFLPARKAATLDPVVALASD